MPNGPLKVFISFTAEDLAEHADVVVDQLRRMEWIAIDHRDWAPSGERSVRACKEKVAECSVLVLLVAHRYGWIPPSQKGGDDRTSITWMEYQWARDMKIPIVPFVAESEDGWPEGMLERLGHPEIEASLKAFKAELRDHIVAFFEHEPHSVLAKLESGLREAGEKIAREGKTPAAQRSDIVPVNLPYLCDRSQQSRLLRQRLQLHLASGSIRPLLFVVHGNADEAHVAFVQRVEGSVLPDLLANTGSRRDSLFVYLPQVEVAGTSSLASDLRLEMSGKVPQLDSGSDAQLLASMRGLRLRSIVVVLQLSASECRRAPAKVLDAVRDYWTLFPDLPHDLMLGCMLCIKYDQEPGFGSWLRKVAGGGSSAEQLRKAVETLAASAANESGSGVCVLPELRSVTRKDIDDWLLDVRAVLRRHVSEQDFHKMFDDGPSLPMDRAIKHLEGVLDSQPPRN